MVTVFNLIEWVISDLLAFGIAFIALRKFKVSPVWAIVIGIVVATALLFPIQTHAIKLDLPDPSSN